MEIVLAAEVKLLNDERVIDCLDRLSRYDLGGIIAYKYEPDPEFLLMNTGSTLYYEGAAIWARNCVWDYFHPDFALKPFCATLNGVEYYFGQGDLGVIYTTLKFAKLLSEPT